MPPRTSFVAENYYEYQPEFNLWSVHFENVRELPVDEVKKIFSKYGTVHHVSQTGSSQGYCFISYRRKQDAKNCVLKLHQEKAVQLRAFNPRVRRLKDKQRAENPPVVHKKKKMSQRKGKSDDNNNLAVVGIESSGFGKYYDARSVFFANKRNLSQDKILAIFSKYGKVDTVQQTGLAGAGGWCFVKYFAEASARKCAMDMVSSGFIQLEEFKPTVDLIRRKKEIVLKRANVAVCEQESVIALPQPSDNLSCTSSASSTCHEHTVYDDDRTELISALSTSKCSKNLLKFVQKVTSISSNGELGESFYVPMNSRVTWRNLQTVIVEQVPAEPVIVANIHETCGDDGIMNLFEELEPILVTKIKVIPEESLRWCYVYLKDEFFAKKAKQDYDNVEICGKKLIVLRPEILIKKS